MRKFGAPCTLKNLRPGSQTAYEALFCPFLHRNVVFILSLLNYILQIDEYTSVQWIKLTNMDLQDRWPHLTLKKEKKDWQG